MSQMGARARVNDMQQDAMMQEQDDARKATEGDHSVSLFHLPALLALLLSLFSLLSSVSSSVKQWCRSHMQSQCLWLFSVRRRVPGAVPMDVQSLTGALGGLDEESVVSVFTTVLSSRPEIAPLIVAYACPELSYPSAKVLMDPRSQGVVKSYNPEKGFGFIECPELHEVFGHDVFLHCKQISGFAKGDSVSFAVALNKDNKPQAYDLQSLNGGPSCEGWSVDSWETFDSEVQRTRALRTPAQVHSREHSHQNHMCTLVTSMNHPQRLPVRLPVPFALAGRCTITSSIIEHSPPFTKDANVFVLTNARLQDGQPFQIRPDDTSSL